MSKGAITITDGRGNIILQGNIWTLLLFGALSRIHRAFLEKMRVFIDGKEIEKPEELANGT